MNADVQEEARRSAERHTLVLGAKRYIILQARKVAPYATGSQRAEMVAWGTAGAARAAMTYDRSRGTFLTYATGFILGAIRDELRRQCQDAGMHRAARMLASELRRNALECGAPERDMSWETEEVTQARLDGLMTRFMITALASLATAPPSPEASLISEQLNRIALATVRETVARRPEKERRIYELRYGQEYEYQQIADALGISESNVRLHHDKLLDALYVALHARGVDGLPGRAR